MNADDATTRGWHRAIQDVRIDLGPAAGADALLDAIRRARPAGPLTGEAILFGSIQWPKRLGRPKAADAAAGFRVASHSRIVGFDSPEGTVYLTLTPEVSFWEVPDPDPDLYQVRIVTSYNTTVAKGPENANMLSAAFSALEWDGPGGVRKLEPRDGFLLTNPDGGLKVAPPFYVYRGASRTYIGDVVSF